MLSLRQLQQFLAVADSMSFRQAADRLNMAQPPLTAAIRQMEEQLGVRLLERTNRITGLTAAGQVLRDEARRTIAQAERTIALTRRAGAGLTGSLRIGFVATAVRHIVPTLIADFRETHPDVALELMEAPSARQVAALLDDRLDLGIVALPLPTGVEREIATRTVLRSELVAALPERHALAQEPTAPLALAALAHEPWILFPANEGPGLHDRIVGACAAAGFAPEVAQRAVQMETIVGLVAAGLGVALVPALFKTTGWSAVVFRAIDGTPVRYEVALAWRRNDGSAALAALLASHAARNPGD
ncbi:LysR family transcriptional regulator [Bradyrhizobium sp. Arg68]|uniref:LysR family transcriptional regulator n=1 Tax=Bradyrhizobium ivorense TaxID=2511166 RepID=UPI001E350EFB|nr:LysR family transcriptional regulator [Bradyrhizobium ivorense]MCC8942045.1 LysR family transcriptional regulator [Bradyrhizobium ivorense]